MLTGTGAGDAAVRGGLMRVAGYAAGLALTAVASVLLLRYLGVVDFGRYFTVVSLVAIVTGLSDAGLTVVGQRGYVRAADEAERRTFLSDLLGLRLLFTLVAILLAVGFAAVAGYERAQVAGTAVAGAGLLFSNAAVTFTVPLSARLRLGAVTLTELVRQTALVAALIALVLAHAGFVSFFYAYLLSGAAMVVAALALIDRRTLTRPAFHRGRWGSIVRQAAPIALGLVVNVVYLRLLVILMSLLSSDTQTGLFGTSYRILEIFVGVPALMAGAAFPILAHAAAADEERLAYVLQRLAEASLLLAVSLVLGLTIAARPIVEILGGAEYADAAGVLSLQALALVGAFLAQVWILGLVAIERNSGLAIVNAVGLFVILALGLTLIPIADARGAAVAAICGEATLAGTSLFLLVRARPALRPHPGRALWIVAAGCLGAACALLPAPDLVRAAVALLVYACAAWMAGAVPIELLRALSPGRQPRA